MHGTTSNDLYVSENVKEEISALNNEITSDEISKGIDKHVRSFDMKVASVIKFMDELHVSIV
jgi:hypothetical protein